MLLIGAGAGRTSWGAEDVPPPTPLEAGDPAPAAGDFWTEDGSHRLLQEFQARRHRAELAEAQVQQLQAQVDALQARLAAVRAQEDVALARVEVERLKCPSWVERHVGWAVGAGGAWAYHEDGSGPALVIGAIYGWRP